LVSLAAAYWVHSHQLPGVVVKPAAPPPPPSPLITVVVPVRNEERNIQACLHALLSQTYTNLDVVVVDDRSEDHTASILAQMAAEDNRIRVIKGRPLPAGWTGKSHALWQGAQKPSAQKHLGTWLCFVDADTFVRPDCMASVLQCAQASGADLFTILTRQRMETFWEKTILPLVFTALGVGFSPRRVNNPKLPDAIANGQFMFFRRSAYEAIGGHRAVSNSIVEDRDLARLVKQSGLRLVVADGQAVAATRMYHNFAEIWEGWTKNIFLGLADDARLAWLGVIGALLSLLGALGLPGWLLAGSLWLTAGGGPFAALVLLQAALACMYLLYWRIRVAQGMGISALYAFTLPLGALVFAAMMFASAFKVLSGRGVTWKGRRYAKKL
jgi:chlorobactene glucosyltransferase